jgi:hypothetical protein
VLTAIVQFSFSEYSGRGDRPIAVHDCCRDECE